jgi:flagellar basal body-associated protein FliL
VLIFIDMHTCFLDAQCKMDIDQIQRTLGLLMKIVLCVAISQLAAVVMMVIYCHFKTMWQYGANKLGEVKRCGCARIKNVAATLRNNQHQQNRASPIEGYEVRPLV